MGGELGTVVVDYVEAEGAGAVGHCLSRLVRMYILGIMASDSTPARG